MSPVMTVEEAAAYLRISKNRVRELFKNKEIKAYGGGQGIPWQTTKASLDDYIQSLLGE